MVPYVRKSFWKHFKDGLEYIEDIPVAKFIEFLTDTKIDLSHIDDIGIDSDFYKKYQKAYKYATDKTVQELEQAVEGMYHNLNTL